MKKLLILVNLLIINQLAISQGILWEKTIEETFRKAKAKNKLVFIECYHPHCPICSSIEPTFKTKELGNFYNKNFVNFKLNLSNVTHLKFLDSKKIHLPSYPLFTYFDANKTLIHIADVGEAAPASNMNNIGTIALDSEKRGSSYQKRYEKGERDLNFLVNYAYLSRVSLDTAKTIQLGNDIYNVFSKEDLPSVTSWLITQKVIMDVDNGFFKYWINHIEEAKKIVGANHPDAEKAALSTLIHTSIMRNIKGTSLDKVQKIREYLTLLGSPEQYTLMSTWQLEANSLFHENQSEKAFALVNSLADKFSNNAPSLTFLASYLIDSSNESKAQLLAHSYLEKAKKITQKPNELAELYYQSARVYQKLGDKNAAQNALNEAKKQATIAKIDAKGLKKFNELGVELK